MAGRSPDLIEDQITLPRFFDPAGAPESQSVAVFISGKLIRCVIFEAPTLLGAAGFEYLSGENKIPPM
jgi:hypothetical protein